MYTIWPFEMLIHSGCISVLWTSQLRGGPECLDATSTELHPIEDAVIRMVRRNGRMARFGYHGSETRQRSGCLVRSPLCATPSKNGRDNIHAVRGSWESPASWFEFVWP